MIDVVELERKYKSSKKTAINNVSTSFQDTGLTCVCGKSGSGKTTFLNILGLQDVPDKGEVRYYGNNIFDFSEKEKNEYRGTVIGRISQDYDLIPGISVYDNCAFPLFLTSQSHEGVLEKIKQALTVVGLDGYETRTVNELSGGEKQRVAIARALVKDVKVLLCDEPTGNLDSEASTGVMTLLKQLSFSKCVIVVTHNKSLAEKYADRIIHIDGGRIVSDRYIETAPNIAPGFSENKDFGLMSKKKNGSAFCYFFRFLCLQVKPRVFSFLLILVLLSVFMGVLLTASYMAGFQRPVALERSLRERHIYSVIIDQYEQSWTDDAEELYYGWRGPGVSSAIVADFKSDNPDLPLGDAYSFSKNFYDFSVGKTFSPDFYHTISFSDFIIVHDFRAFHYPLVCGKLPEKPFEVVISDYIAQMLVWHHVYDDVCKEEDLLGFCLKEPSSGFSMIISGIYKTDYRDLSEVGGDYDFFGKSREYYAQNYCLSVYCSVFGGEEFVNALDEAKFSSSYYEIEYQYIPDYQYPERSVQRVEQGGLRWDLYQGEEKEKGIEILFQSGEGYLVRDTVLADILGVTLNELYQQGPQILEDFVKAPMEHGRKITCGTVVPNLFLDYYELSMVCVGYFHSDEEIAPSLIYSTKPGAEYLSQSAEYLGPVLLLSEDSKRNAEWIVRLSPIQHDSAFWQEYPDDYLSGMGIYTAVDGILDELEDYLLVSNRLYQRYTWLLVFMLAVVLLSYLISSVKKNRRTIGILMANGVSKAKIMGLYSGLSVLITVGAFILSIFWSVFFTNQVNRIFSEGQGYPMVLYSVKIEAVAGVLGVIGVGVIVSLVSLILWIFIRKPISLIYERKE